jgi:hypothetical protein
MNRLLAIDPGNIETAYTLIGEGYKPLVFAKVPNEEALKFIKLRPLDDSVVIEMIASYGMAVGREVFETCVWIGRFQEAALSYGLPVSFIYRSDVKMNLCHSAKAKDANVRQALIDRFASHDMKNGKGTIKNKDWFYGFYKDIWAAYAVGITYIDRKHDEANGRNIAI